MDGLGSEVTFARLVPASLLPPEDPSARPRRTVRDWWVDVLLFLISLGLGAITYAATLDSAVDPVPRDMVFLDLVLGGIGCLALWGRRRWPVGVGVLTAALTVASGSAVVASVVGLFGVAVHRRTTAAIAVGVFGLVPALIFPVVRPQTEELWVSLVIGAAVTAIVIAWGMFVRARRQLVWTLRERAERAETEQRMLADQARLSERTRIAREMHDVLAHRISMVALHAGGLQVRPDLPADEVRETAGLLRTTAQQALEELRGVIGVLREEDATVELAPSPTLCDIPRLVDDTRAAGAKIEFEMSVPEGADPPRALGRDAYRIVQEALTNVAKHASGTATVVRVTGAPGDGLTVDVRNRLPVTHRDSGIPGSGSGLLGLRERVTLSGGSLEHGPNADGEFVVAARLAW